MTHQGYPVYDIKGFAEAQSDVLVSALAPYIDQHRKLRIAHRHRFYHLVYFTKGAGFHTIDFDRFEVRPFQLYAMVPGQVHSWEFAGEVEGYVLNFSTSFFQSFLLRSDYIEDFSFFQGRAQQSVLTVPQIIHTRIIDLFEEMITLMPSIGVFSTDKMRVLALQLFLDLASLQEAAPSLPLSGNTVLLQNFRKLVDRYYAEFRLPRDYAAQLHITPNYLNAICSELLGQSAGEIIRDRIILEAKRLLVNPELTISAVAGVLNFMDNSNFTKFFKKYTGITPENFRKAIAEKSH